VLTSARATQRLLGDQTSRSRGGGNGWSAWDGAPPPTNKAAAETRTRAKTSKEPNAIAQVPPAAEAHQKVDARD
jgi:hypothetical protein